MTKKLTPEGRKTRDEARRMVAIANAMRERPEHIMRTMQVAAELEAKLQARMLEGMTDSQRLKAKAKAEAEAKVKVLMEEYEVYEAAEKARLMASVNAPARPNGPGAGPSEDRAKPLDLSQERIVGLDDLL